MNGFFHKQGQRFKHRRYTPAQSFLQCLPVIQKILNNMSLYLRKLESLTDRAY